MKALLFATIVVTSALVVGVGSATAAPSDGPSLDDRSEGQFEPRDAGNNSSEYVRAEPTQDALDRPIDESTVPENFSRADAEGSGASASGPVLNPNDSDPEVVGTQKQWLALDNTAGYYVKTYTLLEVGDNVEVWVANDLAWPEDDPRADPTITETQAEAIAAEFDENMYPVESELFGTPEPRDGTENLLGPPGYYNTSADAGNRTVLLVDNVRDQNYYDPSYPLYIAGFYSSTIQQFTDRNTITVDAYDWDEVAEDDPTTGYEGTLAHEYQHLIHNDLDSDETSWINEGMSDYAEVATGYGVPESHLSSYEAQPGGSLTNWEDLGGINVLQDYGQAFVYQTYLSDEYGEQFITDLAHDERNGVESVEGTLAERNAKRDFTALYQDFSTAVVTDDIRTPPKDEYHVDGVELEVETEGGLETAGPWGTAYEEVDVSDRGPIQDVRVRGIDYQGTQWATVETDGGTALYSGSGNLLDRHAAQRVDLTDAEDPTLTFETNYDIETGWDYGFVQVSTDGGETWESLSNEDTTSQHADGAHPSVKDNVPGFTGQSDSWETQTFDLSEYEGEEILVSFRYTTDWAVVSPGWHVRNVSVAGEQFSNDASDYLSEREARGDRIDYQFTFIGVKHNGNYQVKQLDLREFDEGGEQELKRFLHNGNFETVVVASTWAADQGESGRVPVGVEFEFAQENGNGNGGNGNNANGNGNGNN